MIFFKRKVPGFFKKNNRNYSKLTFIHHFYLDIRITLNDN